jgi:hypothetical protein
MAVERAPALLRRERRRIRSSFCGEFNAALVAPYIVRRSDETWLPEWSGNRGGVQRWRSSVAWDVLGQASFSAYGVKPVG